MFGCVYQFTFPKNTPTLNLSLIVLSAGNLFKQLKPSSKSRLFDTNGIPERNSQKYDFENKKIVQNSKCKIHYLLGKL